MGSTANQERSTHVEEEMLQRFDDVVHIRHGYLGNLNICICHIVDENAKLTSAWASSPDEAPADDELRGMGARASASMSRFRLGRVLLEGVSRVDRTMLAAT